MQLLVLYIMYHCSLSFDQTCLNLQSVLNDRMKNGVFLSLLGGKHIKDITCGGNMLTIDTILEMT